MPPLRAGGVLDGGAVAWRGDARAGQGRGRRRASGSRTCRSRRSVSTMCSSRCLRNPGICGTDLHIWKGGMPGRKRPSRFRSSLATSLSAPSSKFGLQRQGFPFPGEVVSGEGHVVCGHCRNCLARTPPSVQGHPTGNRRAAAGCVRRVHRRADVQRLGPRSEHSTGTWQSIFDPFGNAVHTALSFDLCSGRMCVITGAGPIGLMGATGITPCPRGHVTSSSRTSIRIGCAPGGKNRRHDGRRGVRQQTLPQTCKTAPGHEGRL